MLQLKPVCFGYLKAALRIINQLIRNFACFFYIFVRIGSHPGFWVFVMIKLSFDPWNGFSIPENHTFDSKIITRQIWGIWKLRPAYSPETPNLGQNRLCFVPCDLEIWWMTLENNRASLLCCFKLCATFHSHRWIQTGVTVRKRPIWVKFDDF